MCQEKKKEEDLAVYEDSVDTSIRRLEDYVKRSKKNKFQWPGTTQTTQGSTEQQWVENKNGKKNEYMDISCDEQVKSHARKLDHG